MLWSGCWENKVKYIGGKFMKEYIYRIHLKPQNDKKENPFKFCKQKSIVGIGWPLDEENLEKFKKESNFENYKKLVLEQYNKDTGLKKAINCYSEIEKDDLIWARDRDNIFYICRVTGKWEYSYENDNKVNDIFSYFPVEYVKVGTVEEVPGKVVNSFRANATLQRIHGKSIFEMTKKIYNKKSNNKLYEIKKIEDFLNFLLPEDVEEIVSLYLQLEKNYLIYTSTNKINTAKYEFVMISRDGKEKCCIQVKTGNTTLDPENYIHLTENNVKVYLFTLEGYKRENINNVICLKKEEILDFIKNNKEILPSRIKYWMNEIQKN
jgi:hypothetical protein